MNRNFVDGLLVNVTGLSVGKFGMPLPLGSVPAPPTGEAWLHEIKHDGFRVIAHKQGDRGSIAVLAMTSPVASR